MPEIHSSLRMVSTRVRGLSQAVANDEPVTLPQLPEPSTPGEPAHVRATVTVSEGLSTMAVGKACVLSRIVTTAPARVRVYDTSAARAADASRATGTLPDPGSGCLLEFISTAGLLGAPLSPAVMANNMDAPPTGNLYCNVEPIGGSASSVTFTYLTLES